MTQRQTHRRLALAPLFLLAAATALAGKGPLYRYGEMWWAEYDPDPKTELLLHFGPPTVTARQQLATAVKERGKDQALESGSLKAVVDDGEEPLPTTRDPNMAALPDERRLPAGAVADYGDKRRILQLGNGLRLVPEGRFGPGLRVEAGGSLRVPTRDAAAAECWFRIDALPAAEACVMSLGNDEARLLLRPDGRLELRLRKPHGNPTAQGPGLQAILERPAEIISSCVIEPNRWTHVAIYDEPHPSPGNTAPWEAQLRVDGAVVANFLSEGGNQYQFFGGRESTLVLGNSADGKQPFTGWLDEVRVSTTFRDYYERPRLPWRDADATRPLQFNRPFFRADSTVLHLSCDKGTVPDLDTAGAGEAQLKLHGEKLDGLLVDGIRGKGWLMDRDIGLARLPLKGITAREGAIEFWLRPVNWDDCTGYWQHSPPERMNLSVARVFAKTEAGNDLQLFNVGLPRAFNLERARLPLDPGHWVHLMLVWDANGWGLYFNGRVINGHRREAGDKLDLPLAAIEFGVTDKVEGIRREPPRIEIDEVVAYRSHLRGDEVTQAHRRWMGKLDAIPLYNAGFEYKWSISKLEFSLVPLLPEGVVPTAASVTLVDLAAAGKTVLGPVSSTAIPKDRFHFVLSEGKPLPYGHYEFRFDVKDKAGAVAVAGTREWKYAEEPWRHCQAGVLDKVLPPWTPIQVKERELRTRMTRYLLGTDGLPQEIHADGVNILQAPFQILEDGKPLTGTLAAAPQGKEIEANWTAAFTGSTVDVGMACRLEYDGMIRYELALKPKGKLGTLAFVMPVKAANAKRWLAYPVGARGPHTGEIGKADGLLLTSRADPAPYQTWRAYTEERKKNPKLEWAAYWKPIHDGMKQYGFYTHADINDMNRGLWWFCDNAAGWVQSKERGAVEIQRQGESVTLVLNLVAEPADYKPGKPIVFGILPHPARPLPDKYRLFEKGTARDARVGDIYDAFFPWAKPPRGSGSLCMTLFPAPDPKKPEAGPSWEYAESCIPLMKAVKPKGLRTMYLSKAWFSCRAGAYDNWEWRSGETGTVSLTPSFVNYLCWEINEWIRRDFWDAIYLDECYEHAATNLEAGMSVLLPDGKEQPGVTNFQFRELIKRWRGIFVQHGKEPMLLSHLTYSWQYPGIVFFDSYLDGENRPIVSLNSPDWIDSTSRTQFEVVQNGALWGLSSFYMPFIAEGGFDNKSKSQYPRWQWRMARQAQSQFAHYETCTVYECQGGQVYKAYWKDVFDWGAADPKVASFHPYWNNSDLLQVDGQGGDTLVSCYRAKGRVLLIASNRKRQECELRIRLDRKALGLKPDAAARDIDSGATPPAGEDYIKEQVAATTKNLDKDPTAVPTDGKMVNPEDLLDDEKTKETEKQAGYAPRLEGDTLVIPVRARDFRLIAIE